MVDGDGCSKLCKIESGWQCTSTGTEKSVCSRIPVQNNTPSVNSPPSTSSTSTKATSTAGIATPVVTVTAAAIGLSSVAGMAPSAVYMVIEQCQNIQVMTLFNMNNPNDYISFSKSFGVTKLDIFLGDMTDTQSDREAGTRRNLKSMHTPIYNAGYKHGSFIVNYIYYFILLGLLFILNMIIVVIVVFTRAGTTPRWPGRCMRAAKRAFEFYIYLYLLVYGSLFIFVLTLFDMIAANFSSAMTRASFAISILFFIFMIGLICLPFILMWTRATWMNKIKKIEQGVADENGQKEEEVVNDYDAPTCIHWIIERLWLSYTYGFKANNYARAYFAIFMMKQLCYAIIFVCISNSTAQVVLFIITTFTYLLYLVVVRPFEYIIQNIVAIGNQVIVLICGFLMIEILETGHMSRPAVMIALFTFSIVCTLVISILFSVYRLLTMRKEASLEDIEEKATPVSTSSCKGPKKAFGEDKDNLGHVFNPVRADSEAAPPNAVYVESVEDEMVDEESKWLDGEFRGTNRAVTALDRNA